MSKFKAALTLAGVLADAPGGKMPTGTTTTQVIVIDDNTAQTGSIAQTVFP